MLTKFQLENYDGAGFVFMTEDWKFIMVKDRMLSKWGMCKGHRDPEDDHYLDTAKREAFEELGLYDDDYNIVSEPFVFPGSPKIYIFHMAILTKPYESIDIADKDIRAIKIVTFDELLEQLDLNDTNIYMRLFHAHIMGTFHPKKKIATEKKVFNPPINRRHVLFGGFIAPHVEPLILPEEPIESHTVVPIRISSPCMKDYVDPADEEVASLWNEPPPRSPRSPRPSSRCAMQPWVEPKSGSPHIGIGLIMRGNSPKMIRPVSRNSFKA